MNTKQIDLLTNALDDAKRVAQEMEKKRQSKLLVPVKEDFDFVQLLNLLTKPELDEIRKKLDVKNASSFTKAKLIDVLTVTIRNSIKYILSNMGYREFVILKKFIQEDKRVLENRLENYDDIFKLREWGIVFAGVGEDKKPVIIIPEEIYNEIKIQLSDDAFIKKLEDKHNWLRVTTGLLYYVGTMEKEKVHKNVQEILGQPVNAEEYKDYIENNSGENSLIKVLDNIYCYQDVFNPEDIYEKQMLIKNFDYVSLTLDEVLEASKDGFKEWDDETLLYKYIIDKFGLSKDAASDIIDGCIYFVKNDYPVNSVLMYIEATVGIMSQDEINDISAYLQELINTLRLWVNKGYTIYEIEGLEEYSKEVSVTDELPDEVPSKPQPIRVVKIGRNEPCPCGSGKKYKRCCGRNK